MWIRDQDREGFLVTMTTPRSYIIETPQGQVRRYRSALVQVQTPVDPDPIDQPNPSDQPVLQTNKLSNRIKTPVQQGQRTVQQGQHCDYKTRSGRVIKSKTCDCCVDK